MSILSVRGADGNFVTIPALVGPPGNSGVHVGTQEPSDNEVKVWVKTDGTSTNTVLYSPQVLTEEQKVQVRNNICAASLEALETLNTEIEEKTKVASVVEPNSTLAVSGAAVAAYVKSYMAQFPSYEEVAF